MFLGRLRLLAAGLVDQHLLPGGRRGTRLPSGRDGRPRLCRLCGGRRCPSRYTVGAWRRHLPWYEVDAFCRRTCPWHLLHHEDTLVSFDEHTIPRWTRKFPIGKGYVTTRNKYMRCEKLFAAYDLVRGRFLGVRGTPGSCNLQELAVPLVQQALRQGRPRSLHALFDA